MEFALVGTGSATTARGRLAFQAGSRCSEPSPADEFLVVF
jgi:hypothetical protein